MKEPEIYLYQNITSPSEHIQQDDWGKNLLRDSGLIRPGASLYVVWQLLVLGYSSEWLQIGSTLISTMLWTGFK